MGDGRGPRVTPSIRRAGEGADRRAGHRRGPRRGDVWLARSRRYGDIRKALLSAPAVADADRSLPAPASPHDWLAERRFALDEGLRRLAAAARAGAVAGGSIEDSVLRVERTETAVPDGAADLVADLYRRMPEARITDILLEVDDATRFTEAFTHLRTGEPCRDRIGLLNVLLAEGINLGLRKMAEATNTHGFWELMRIARWHVEGDAFDRALAVVVEAQAALPMEDVQRSSVVHPPRSRATVMRRVPMGAAAALTMLNRDVVLHGQDRLHDTDAGPRVLPEQLAVGRRDADHAVVRQQCHLRHAVDRNATRPANDAELTTGAPNQISVSRSAAATPGHS